MGDSLPALVPCSVTASCHPRWQKALFLLRESSHACSAERMKSLLHACSSRPARFAGAALASFALLGGHAFGQKRLARFSSSEPNNVRFGYAVAVDGSRAAVTELGPGFAPRVHVYEDDGNGAWSSTARIDLPAIGSSANHVVELEGDRLAVLQFDGSVAYVYDNDGSGWALTDTLERVPAAASSSFSDLDLEGDRILLGSPGDDQFAGGAGAAYVYELVGGAWQLDQKLFASDAAAVQFFGNAVALVGDQAFVGASSRTNSVGTIQGGGIYVFEKLGGTWVETALIEESDPTLRFLGRALASDGTRILASIREAPEERVVEYTWDGLRWERTEVITPVAACFLCNYGSPVRLEGSWLAVGSSSRRGGVHLYRDVQGTWMPYRLLQLSFDWGKGGGSLFDTGFGRALALQDDTLFVGATTSADPAIPSSCGNAWLIDLAGRTRATRANRATKDQPRSTNR